MRKLLLMAAVAAGLAGCPAAPNPAAAGSQPPIVLVAFGTSVPRAQAALENIDRRVREAHPGREIRWAFTSGIILEKLRRQGRVTLFEREVPLRSLPEVYADLAEEGHGEAVVQSLHVSPGQEYEEMRAVDPGPLEVRYGLPLLADDGAVAELARALRPRFGGERVATVLCGHGNGAHPEFNEMLLRLDRHVRDHYRNVWVATVDGDPGTERPFAEIRASGCSRVLFVPVMVVAGDHMMNDVMGDDPESWRNRLGLPATAAPGMGEDDRVVDLFLARLAAAEAAP